MKLELKDLRNAVFPFPQKEQGRNAVEFNGDKKKNRVKSKMGEETEGEGSKGNKEAINKN